MALCHYSMNESASNADTTTARAIAEYYDYGYPEEQHQLEMQRQSFTDRVGMRVRFPEFPEECRDSEPMSPERMARKQRSLSRRNGEGHSSLLKSAVLASMDSLELSEDEEDESRHSRQGSLIVVAEGPIGPRKRARRFSSDSSTVEDEALVHASYLFSSVMAISVDDGLPVRRVSRRTSHRSPQQEGKDE